MLGREKVAERVGRETQRKSAGRVSRKTRTRERKHTNNEHPKLEHELELWVHVETTQRMP